jgi:hypothetical protein
MPLILSLLSSTAEFRKRGSKDKRKRRRRTAFIGGGALIGAGTLGALALSRRSKKSSPITDPNRTLGAATGTPLWTRQSFGQRIKSKASSAANRVRQAARDFDDGLRVIERPPEKFLQAGLTYGAIGGLGTLASKSLRKRGKNASQETPKTRRKRKR